MATTEQMIARLLADMPHGEVFEARDNEAICLVCPFSCPWYSGLEEELLEHLTKHGYRLGA